MTNGLAVNFVVREAEEMNLGLFRHLHVLLRVVLQSTLKPATSPRLSARDY